MTSYMNWGEYCPVNKLRGGGVVYPSPPPGDVPRATAGLALVGGDLGLIGGGRGRRTEALHSAATQLQLHTRFLTHQLGWSGGREVGMVGRGGWFEG